MLCFGLRCVVWPCHVFRDGARVALSCSGYGRIALSSFGGGRPCLVLLAFPWFWPWWVALPCLVLAMASLALPCLALPGQWPAAAVVLIVVAAIRFMSHFRKKPRGDGLPRRCSASPPKPHSSQSRLRVSKNNHTVEHCFTIASHPLLSNGTIMTSVDTYPWADIGIPQADLADLSPTAVVACLLYTSPSPRD